MKAHYAVEIIVNIACGIPISKHTKCPHCKMVKHGRFLKTTFIKKKVTCKNCKRTKAYKKRRQL